MRLFILLATAAAMAMGGCTPGNHGYLDPGPGLPPGQTLVASPWRWPRQGPPAGEFARLRVALRTPDDIAAWLEHNTEWRDDYDTSRFLTASELIEQKRGVCTAFARAWAELLAAQQKRAVFVAVWGPESAHAYTIFRDGDRWRLCSNQYLYENDLGVERDAAIATANAEFYGSGGWSEYQIFDVASGAVVQRVRNDVAPVLPLAPEAPQPRRNLFTVRR